MSALKQRENPGRSKPRVPSLGCSEPCTKPKLQPQVPLRASSLPSMGSSSRKIGGEIHIGSFPLAAFSPLCSGQHLLILPCSSPAPLLILSWSPPGPASSRGGFCSRIWEKLWLSLCPWTRKSQTLQPHHSEVD